MRDIARRAGAPVSAVPLVLANKPGVSPTRRARIQAAVQELGYTRPAGPARPTRRHRLGLVIEARGVPIFTDYYYGEILVGIQTEAKRLGLSVWLHTFDPEVELIEDVARSARDEVDGLIIVSGGDMTDERIVHLERTGPADGPDRQFPGRPRIACRRRRQFRGRLPGGLLPARARPPPDRDARRLASLPQVHRSAERL